jgi:hypothetical protein
MTNFKLNILFLCWLPCCVLHPAARIFPKNDLYCLILAAIWVSLRVANETSETVLLSTQLRFAVTQKG